MATRPEPVLRKANALQLDEIAEEVSQKVEHVNALVEEDPASSCIGVIPPIAVPRLPLSPQHRSISLAVDDRLHDPEVISMVEAGLHCKDRVPSLCLYRRFDAFERPAGRLLAENVLPRVQRRHHDLGSDSVGRANEERIGIGIEESIAISGHLQAFDVETPVVGVASVDGDCDGVGVDRRQGGR